MSPPFAQPAPPGYSVLLPYLPPLPPAPPALGSAGAPPPCGFVPPELSSSLPALPPPVCEPPPPAVDPEMELYVVPAEAEPPGAPALPPAV